MGSQQENITKIIRESILSGEKGRIYFIKDFAYLENDTLVTKVLYRLEADKLLIRLANGIYLYPIKNRFGISYPSLDSIAKSIANRDKTEIMPTGSTALNQLGLSTQVPMNAIYLTTGSPRTIQIGNRKITFKKSVPKNFSYKGRIFPLVVSSMKALGAKNINNHILNQIEEILLKADEKDTIDHDITLAPSWIRNLLLPILKKQNL